jgi:hypothetical protein
MNSDKTPREHTILKALGITALVFLMLVSIAGATGTGPVIKSVTVTPVTITQQLPITVTESGLPVTLTENGIQTLEYKPYPTNGEPYPEYAITFTMEDDRPGHFGMSFTSSFGSRFSSGPLKYNLVDYIPGSSLGNYHLNIKIYDSSFNPTNSFDCDINIIPQTIPDLIGCVQQYGTHGYLSKNDGQTNSLIVKLNAANKNVNNGNKQAASNELNSFINKVNTDINTGKLRSPDGQYFGQMWIDGANVIIETIK